MSNRTTNIAKPRARAKKRATRIAQPADPVERPQGKLSLILDHVDTKAGATIDELTAVTGWQKHSVHGAMSRLRSRGFAIRRQEQDGRQTYQLQQA
jgi:hypothetical protein